MTLVSTMKQRSSSQANANTETQDGVVTKLYNDSVGNIIAADVRLAGLAYPLVRCPNASGVKLWKGAQVTVNWARGSRFAPVIITAGGSETGAMISAAAASTTAAVLGQTITTPSLDGVPFLMLGQDDSLPDAYVEMAGANVTFTDTPGGPTSGGFQNGQRTVDVKPLVASTLPNATLTTLPDGTILDLMDGAGLPLGMYRLDRSGSSPVWRRRDSAGDATAVIAEVTAARSSAVKGITYSSLDARLEAEETAAATTATTAATASTTATTAATTAAAASTMATATQTEVVNARSSAVTATTHASLDARLEAMEASILLARRALVPIVVGPIADGDEPNLLTDEEDLILVEITL